MKNPSLNYILKGTEKAIKEVVQKWYADCYITEKDVSRLLAWENHIVIYLSNNNRSK